MTFNYDIKSQETQVKMIVSNCVYR